MSKKNIGRRNFIRQAGLGSLAFGIPISANRDVLSTYKDTSDQVLNDPNDISPKDKTYKASELYKFNQKI